MTDSTRAAIVTGANSGLGLECARALLATDPSWHVVLAVRDPQRGADVLLFLAQDRGRTALGQGETDAQDHHRRERRGRQGARDRERRLALA